jgi:hypothetical protein
LNLARGKGSKETNQSVGNQTEGWKNELALEKKEEQGECERLFGTQNCKRFEQGRRKVYLKKI